MNDLIAFIEELLDDWVQDEYQIAGEFCCSAAEHRAVEDDIAARRARWQELKERLR